MSDSKPRAAAAATGTSGKAMQQAQHTGGSAHRKVHQTQKLTRQMTIKQLPQIEDSADLKRSIGRHLFYTLLRDRYNATDTDLYTALAMSIRDQIAGKWITTERQSRESNSKYVYYLSMEFYMGRLLKNAITNLDLHGVVGEAMNDVLWRLCLLAYRSFDNFI